MRHPRNSMGVWIAAILAIAASHAAHPAYATDGYFSHGFGAVGKSMAGAGVAFSQDAMAQAVNPAGLVFVDTQVNAALSFFSPMREITGSGTPGFAPSGTVESESEIFFIPNVAVNYRVRDDLAFGLALYGNGGMNTDYPNVPRPVAECGGGSGVFCGGEAGVDLSQLFLQPTVAFEVADGIAIGAGPIFAAQRFKAKGLVAFSALSSDPANLTDRRYDWSYGVGGRIGVEVALPSNLRLGLAYQLRTYMTEFDKYAGLFAEQGDFDIPPAIQAGLAWQPTDDVTLLVDYKHIWYSDIPAVGNPFASPGLLGNDNGPGFGWEDINIVKFGAQWQMDEAWTLRAGYSYGENPIGSSEVLFNILAPGVMEHHITGGASYKIDENNTLVLAAMFAPSSSVSGINPLTPTQTIELEMHQFEFTVGWAWRF